MAELHAVREALNELPFHRGKRQILLGNVAEMFPREDDEAIGEKLRIIERELQKHDLLLVRDQDDLFAVQELRKRESDLSWLGDGMAWSTKITAVALEMILPGLAGWWLGKQIGVPYLALIGLALGLPLGIWHLIVMTRQKPMKQVEPKQ